MLGKVFLANISVTSLLERGISCPFGCPMPAVDAVTCLTFPVSGKCSITTRRMRDEKVDAESVSDPQINEVYDGGLW